jgi:hypothetical protein
VYQLQPVVVQQVAEEVSRLEVEAALEEGTEDDLLLDILAWEILLDDCPPLHLRLRPQQPPVCQHLDLGLGHRRLDPCRRGSGMQAASTAISLLGFELDLKWHRHLMRIRWRNTARSGGASASLAGGGRWARRCGSTAVARSL